MQKHESALLGAVTKPKSDGQWPVAASMRLLFSSRRCFNAHWARHSRPHAMQALVAHALRLFSRGMSAALTCGHGAFAGESAHRQVASAIREAKGERGTPSPTFHDGVSSFVKTHF